MLSGAAAVFHPVGTVEHHCRIALRQRLAVQAGAQKIGQSRVLGPLTGPAMQARQRQQPKSSRSELLPQASAIMSGDDGLSRAIEIGEFAAKTISAPVGCPRHGCGSRANGSRSHRSSSPRSNFACCGSSFRRWPLRTAGVARLQDTLMDMCPTARETRPARPSSAAAAPSHTPRARRSYDRSGDKARAAVSLSSRRCNAPPCPGSSCIRRCSNPFPAAAARSTADQARAHARRDTDTKHGRRCRPRRTADAVNRWHGCGSCCWSGAGASPFPRRSSSCLTVGASIRISSGSWYRSSFSMRWSRSTAESESPPDRKKSSSQPISWRLSTSRHSVSSVF